ncbi:MAG: flagellar biosynthetic protein FliO [Bryobacterales bacterium]|nr:flagellar biosynthetic protein FliO [Bryobacterales bacterium]
MDEWVRYTASVVLVIGALLWVRSRLSGARVWSLGGGRTSEKSDLWRMERLSSLRLSHQHTIHLVRVGEQAWLIGCSPGSASMIGQLTAPSTPSKPQETL